jgi:hypothetical protein
MICGSDSIEETEKSKFAGGGGCSPPIPKVDTLVVVKKGTFSAAVCPLMLLFSTVGESENLVHF